MCNDPVKFIKMQTRGRTATSRFYHNLDETLPDWKKHGFATAILNFHNGHVLTSLLCDILDDAPSACRESRHRSIRHVDNRRAVYDSIVFAAAENGLIDLNQSRQDAATNLQAYYEQELGLLPEHFPFICPERHELETFLNKSLTLEKNVVPVFFASQHGESEHRASFWHLANRRKEFCRVDTDRLLNGKTSWQEVLESWKTNT